MTLCKDCEYFKIRQQPIKGFDWGMAECTKYDLVVDFADKRKFKWLSCEDRPKHGERNEEIQGRGMKRKDALWVMQMCRDRDAWSEAEREAFDTAIEALKNESIFTADRPKGEWIHTPNGIDRDFVWWTCSECGHKIFSETEKDRIEFHAYCGRCGAYMRADMRSE